MKAPEILRWIRSTDKDSGHEFRVTHDLGKCAVRCWKCGFVVSARGPVLRLEDEGIFLTTWSDQLRSDWLKRLSRGRLNSRNLSPLEMRNVVAKFRKCGESILEQVLLM